MLDFKTILHYKFVGGLSGRNIAAVLDISKSGVNDFLRAFDDCESLSWPLPPDITNLGIYEAVYDRSPGRAPDPSFAFPDYAEISKQMKVKNMTLKHQWNIYRKKCEKSGQQAYSYRQFCRYFEDWCDTHGTTWHFGHEPGRLMEVDFAGQTFSILDRVTGDPADTVTVFVAVLPYSQAIYAEGMTDISEPYWINVHNNALKYFGGVPYITTCDNCKQGILSNKDWIAPDINPTYQEWAEWNGTAILPAKVYRPTYKGSVEGAVGILEKGPFHDLSNIPFFSLSDFNQRLGQIVNRVNDTPFSRRPHCRNWYLSEERALLQPLPEHPYEYTTTTFATVRSDAHVAFSNAYYSVDYKHKKEKVSIRATTGRVRIFTINGELLADWDRATEPGEWKTDPAHMPAWYHEYTSCDEQTWIQRAIPIGTNTTLVIQHILTQGTHAIQSYRQCSGILQFATKYSPEILEECCAQAVTTGHMHYTYIRDTIGDIQAQLNEQADKAAEPHSDGAYFTAPSVFSLDSLMKKTTALMEHKDDKER